MGAFISREREKKNVLCSLHLAYRILICFFFISVSFSFLIISFHQRHGISDCFFNFCFFHFLCLLILCYFLLPFVEHLFISNIYYTTHTYSTTISPTARTPLLSPTCVLHDAFPWHSSSHRPITLWLFLFSLSLEKKTKAVGKWIERFRKKGFSSTKKKKQLSHNTTFFLPHPFVVTIIICYQN